MHPSLNNISGPKPADSVHGSSILFSNINPLTIKIYQPITPTDKTISDFLAQYKSLPNNNIEEAVISEKITPSNKTTTNESYSIERFHFPDSSEFIARHVYSNSAVPSQPMTSRENQKEITFTKDLMKEAGDNIAVIDYEEFVLDDNLEFIKKKPTTRQKSAPQVSMTPAQEYQTKPKTIQHIQDSGNILSTDLKVEYRRNNTAEKSKVLSETPSKDIVDRKDLPSTAKTRRTKRDSMDADESNIRRCSKGVKERGDISTENSEYTGSPDHTFGNGLLFKEVELLRSILREKEMLLEAEKGNKGFSAEIIRRNEGLIVENSNLKCEIGKLSESLKQGETEFMHLTEKNQHQREIMIKLEEKYNLIEKMNLTLEKEVKSQEETIGNLKEENKVLKEDNQKYKESCAQLKNKLDSIVKGPEKPDTGLADKLNLYKLKIGRLSEQMKEMKEINFSRENKMSDLLQRLDDKSRQLAAKENEITQLKIELAKSNEDVKGIKGEKIKLRAKSNGECNVKPGTQAGNRRKIPIMVTQSKDRNSMTMRSTMDLTRGNRVSQDSYSESINYLTLIDEEKKGQSQGQGDNSPSIHKKPRGSAQIEQQKKVEKSVKSIKLAQIGSTLGTKASHLSIAKEQTRNTEGSSVGKNELETLDFGFRSARGETRGSLERMKTSGVIESPVSSNFRGKTLRIDSAPKLIDEIRIKRKCETYRPIQAQHPDKEKPVKNIVGNDNSHKRFPSQSSDDEGNGAKSARGTRYSSKRSSNVDTDYFDPHTIAPGVSKISQLQTPMSISNMSLDLRKDLLSTKSSRSQILKLPAQKVPTDKTPLNSQQSHRKVKGIVIPGLEIPKTLAETVIKSERVVKSARKK